jgi:glycerol-3-phosphate dehydrogenase
LRPLRGSHLVVDDARLPLAQCVAFEHPNDGRPVFAYPWQGRTLVGTTDVDHDASLNDEPAVSREEFAYLMEAIAFAFPGAGLSSADVIATYAGVRPVVASREGAPSKASRDHVVWIERGVVTITGGKLTTFRPMALDALRAAAPRLPPFDLSPLPVFAPVPSPRTDVLDATARRRLAGRFGSAAAEIVAGARAGELARIGSTGALWAELRWCARNETVVHLDDLLLRRTRIGLLLREGGMHEAQRIGEICRDELGWDAARLSDEFDRYRALWSAHYGLPQ